MQWQKEGLIVAWLEDETTQWGDPPGQVFDVIRDATCCEVK